MNTRKQQFLEDLAEAKDYPKELYLSLDRLDKRLKHEKRQKRLLYGGLPAFAASFLFILLLNTNITFARALYEVPFLSRIAESVIYNTSLKSAIENEHIQYVNLKGLHKDMPLNLPYVISDERNLLLFFEVPKVSDNLAEGSFMIQVESMTDLDSGEKIHHGYTISASGFDFEYEDLESVLSEVLISFVEVAMPRNLGLTVTLNHFGYEGAHRRSLGYYRYAFNLTLQDPKPTKILSMDQEVMLEGQRILFEELTLFPTGSELTYRLPSDNTMDLMLHFTKELDGVSMPLGSSGAMFQDLPDGTHITWLRMQDNYFSPPKTRTLVLESYSMVPKDRAPLTLNLAEGFLEENPYGLRFHSLERHEDGYSFFIETEGTYALPPISFITNDAGEVLHTTSESLRGDHLFGFTLKGSPPKTLSVEVALGPLITLEDPIFIPLPTE
ncbi:MAG TPA: hypothetical protein DEA52_02795 [Clostridiaceae bacterium]|nr:hypothetical protein [Clostridiaceae bacterium]